MLLSSWKQQRTTFPQMTAIRLVDKPLVYLAQGRTRTLQIPFCFWGFFGLKNDSLSCFLPTNQSEQSAG